jgi:hypothetical protein
MSKRVCVTIDLLASSPQGVDIRLLFTYHETVSSTFAGIGPATRLTIAVEPPATMHELSIGTLQAWLDTNGKSPREQAT